MKEKIFKMLKNKKNIYLICSCMLILIVLAFAIGNNNLTAKDNEAIDTENDYVISPLDIKEILLSDTGASIAVNFSDYNSVPMKYNNTKNNGAVDFYEINYQGNEYLTGWIQIFDLKNQGLKTDDACIAYSYKTTNLEKNYGKKIGRTTIIPVYNYNTEKKVLHKKYCLGLSGYGYLWDEDSHVSAHITDESNVYEWVDDKWNYVGKLGEVIFSERDTGGNMVNYELSEYVYNAYEWIKYDQKLLVNKKVDAEFKIYVDKLNEFGITVNKKYNEMAVHESCENKDYFRFNVNELGELKFESFGGGVNDECDLKIAEFNTWYTQTSAPFKEERRQLDNRLSGDLTDYTVLYEK